ncbi:MAG: sigma-70 family RNA polymerase sigma factor [Kiritimatiellae bacterium]|nr:sigma-70 family RNA polymerase sigma factor [Kiritimatiellia bacterium]
MNAFPTTSMTLIEKIKSAPPGADEAQWVRFWDLYVPAMRQLAKLKGGAKNTEDIVMRVLERLVQVLREGRYDPQTGRFRSYLATMVCNEVHMQHRRDEVRHENDHMAISDEVAEVLPDTSMPMDERLEEDWKRAILAAAVEHVLTRSALSDRDRSVYREYALEGRPIEEVAAKFGITRNFVSQIKTRIERRIAAVGREMAAVDR